MEVFTLRNAIFMLCTCALLVVDSTKAAEEKSLIKVIANGEPLPEGKTQKADESLVDGNGMNHQTSNMARGPGSSGRGTDDDNQLQEFASIEKADENDELDEKTIKKRVRRWFVSSSGSRSSGRRRRTFSSRRRTFSSRRRTFSSRRRTFSSRRRTFSSRRRTFSSRRRTFSSRRRTFSSRRRTFSSRRRTFSSRRRTFSSRRRTFSSRRRTFSSRRRTFSSRRRTLSSRRRTFSSRRRTFSSRRRTFSSRRRTVCKRQTNCPFTKENTPGAKGNVLVRHVVSKVEKELGGTHGLLGRTAIVESRNGEDKNTYRKGYNGGIFQVDKIGFKDTQDVKSHGQLRERFKIIKEKFGIDWQKVTWKDLRKPLYSAIAARLLYLNKPEKIPKDLKKQAAYWKKYYNSEHKNAKGSAQKFLERVKAAEKKSGG